MQLKHCLDISVKGDYHTHQSYQGNNIPYRVNNKCLPKVSAIQNLQIDRYSIFIKFIYEIVLKQAVVLELS